MEQLDEKVKRVQLERELRYPMLDIRDNRKEIREIAEATVEYMVELDSDLIRPKMWEAIPRIVMEFLSSSCKYLGERKTTKVSKIFVPLGNIMTVGIEYAETAGADKQGTFNPVIEIGPELDYDKRDLPYNDDIDVDMAAILQEEGATRLLPQFFNDRETIEKITSPAIQTLSANYGIHFGKSWRLIPLAFVAFFRKTKEYLIAHKDDEAYGIEINLGDLISIGISRDGDEKSPDYFIYVTPGQKFKLNNAKDDGATER